ncbi:hypothetical protein BC835DRAFT_628225 [Cytidiella melzeri]|nr:hypothetical protein BC835DRAFT_628225 [Cytidiella melzeri]
MLRLNPQVVPLPSSSHAPKNAKSQFSRRSSLHDTRGAHWMQDASFPQRLSLWDYQRSLPYGLGQGNVTGLGLTPEEAKHKTPAGSTSEPSSIPFSHNISNTSVMTSSHFSTISRPSFGLTSAPSPNSQSTSRLHSPVPERASKSSHKERGVKPDVDGYPFPRTPTSSVATSLRSTKPHQTVPYPVQATASPAISWTSTSGSVTPLAQSPQSPPPLREESPLVSSAHVGRPSIKPVQSKSTKTVKQMDHQRRQEDRQTARESISLTELCSSSPFAWSAGLVFPPPSSITGSSLSSGSLVNSSSNSSGRRSSAALSRGSGSSSVGAVNSPRSEGVDVAAVDEALEAEATQQEQSSGMLSPVAEAENATTGEDAKSDDIKIEKSSHRRLQRGRDLERERRREQRKLERKMTEADLNAADGALTESVSSGVSSPGSERGRGGKTRRSPKLKKVKGKSDNEPIASVAASSVFLPKETNSALGRAHLLGDSRERKREAAEIAKDQVLAHRERDREHARLTEQWSLSDDDSRLSSQVKTCLEGRSFHRRCIHLLDFLDVRARWPWKRSWPW